jgi:hypothetical protein
MEFIHGTIKKISGYVNKKRSKKSTAQFTVSEKTFS